MKKKENIPQNHLVEPWLEQLLLTVRAKLQRIAFALQQKTTRYSKNSLKMLLFCFLAVGLTINVVVLYRGVTGRGWAQAVTPVQALRLRPFVRPGPAGAGGREEERLHHFLGYMDSLEQTAAGKRIRDSILQGRPGLLDSLHQLKMIAP